MADILRTIEIGGKRYDVRLGDGGVEMTPEGHPFPHQYLLYDNLRVLIETKNEVFEQVGHDAERGNKKWRSEVRKKMLGYKK